MIKNLGPIDRSVRVVAALALELLVFGGVVTGVFAALLMLIGVIILLSSVVGFCPLYTALHWNTRPPAGSHREAAL